MGMRIQSGKPVTVVHAIGSLDRGGAESVALGLAKSLDKTRFRQIFICTSGQEGTLAHEFRAAGAEVVALPMKPFLGFAWRLCSLLRNTSADVFQSHISVSSGLLLPIARIAGIRNRIARFHSEGDGRTNSRKRWLYRAFMRLSISLFATRVSCVSNRSLEFALGRFSVVALRRAIPLRQVCNGVDLDIFHVAKRADNAVKRQVLHVGRAAPEKNRQILPSILEALRTRGPYEMTLVGPGSTGDLPHLPKDDFTVVGESNDVSSFMSRASVLILPSLREGLPGVILEALASGVPVVASDLPSLRELSNSLKGIRLVDLQSKADVWAEAIDETYLKWHNNRNDLRNDLINSKYSLKCSAEEWTNIWLEFIK